MRSESPTIQRSDDDEPQIACSWETLCGSSGRLLTLPAVTSFHTIGEPVACITSPSPPTAHTSSGAEPQMPNIRSPPAGHDAYENDVTGSPLLWAMLPGPA